MKKQSPFPLLLVILILSTLAAYALSLKFLPRSWTFTAVVRRKDVCINDLTSGILF